MKKTLRKIIEEIIAYPPKGNPRRTRDGYPAEYAYDEYAYQRMVRSYRIALKNALRDTKPRR